MTVQGLIDALEGLEGPKDRDVSVHVHGVLSGIIDVIGVDETGGTGEPSETTVYIDARPYGGTR
jgi:hypothetical protein